MSDHVSPVAKGWVVIGLALVAAIFWPGLYGGFLFDDFVNVVDNPVLRGADWNPASLWHAMWSSPTQQLPRPLAMLTFALGVAVHGMDPFWFKLVNLSIHLANVVLLAHLCIRLLRAGVSEGGENSDHRIAWILAFAWALLPINLTPVLYVVQRMESLAATFVLVGLLAYLRIRQDDCTEGSVWRAAAALGLFTLLGVAVKESAAALPAFALVLELTLLKFRDPGGRMLRGLATTWAIIALACVLFAGFVVHRFSMPGDWALRDFNQVQRLLTESRVLLRYLSETLWPLPGTLHFYYDDIVVSKTLFDPWTTAMALGVHALLITSALVLMKRRALTSFGILWFYVAHAITAGPIPLELGFEHRNYLASFGVLLAIAGLFRSPFRPARRRLLITVASLWLVLIVTTTHLRAREWSHPYRLAVATAAAAPNSSRAFYDLGLVHLIQAAAHDSDSTRNAALGAFRHSASLPRASPAALAAIVTTEARSGRAPQSVDWNALQLKFRQGPIGPMEVSVLQHLAKCAAQAGCAISAQQVDQSFGNSLASGRDGPALYLAYLEWTLANTRNLGAGRRIVLSCLSRHPTAEQCKSEADALLAAQTTRTGR